MGTAAQKGAFDVTNLAPLPLINLPWQHNCFDCHDKTNTMPDYGVFELQSWYSYGITEALCNNSAAALDATLGVNPHLTANLFFTSTGDQHYSSCAVAINRSCSVLANDSMILGGLYSNVSIFNTTYGSTTANACSLNSSGYFVTSSQNVVNKTNFLQVGTFHVGTQTPPAAMTCIILSTCCCVAETGGETGDKSNQAWLPHRQQRQ